MACIESVATATSRRRLFPRGALRLADDALTRCIEEAGREPGELDLLVNAGIYREKNLAEPALAAMIQEDIGANPGHPPREHEHGTFSFDIANGGAGVVTGFEIVDGLIASQTVELGAVVASDSDPGNAEHFPFPAAAGAALLCSSDAGTGFLGFDSDTFPEFSALFESSLVWRPSRHVLPFSPGGENVLEMTCHDEFAFRAVDCAEVVLRRFLDTKGLGPGDVDLLVTSTFPRTFAADVARRLGIAPERLALPAEGLAGAHTAGVLASLEPALRSGKLSRARHVLFASVGAGITVAAALYRHPGAR
jgi:3-oxoacyl-[acyl-carrier-protein] synthase-3